MPLECSPMEYEIERMNDSPDIEPMELWQSPCFIAQNPFHTLQKEALKRHIYDDAASSDTDVKSQVAITAKKHLQESQLNFLENENADIQMLNAFLTDTVTMIAGEVNAEFWPPEANAMSTITESWYHITKPGGYHDAHSHPNCSWCGIYYLEVGETDFSSRSGVNRFYDPRVNADHYLDAGSLYLNGTGVWDFEPIEGQVVIFPSYLKHSALPYFGHSDRIVIAFNARVDLRD